MASSLSGEKVAEKSSSTAVGCTLRESSIEILVKPLMPIGVTLSQEVPLPKIIQLLPSSPLLGKLFVGDIIVSINDKGVKNTPDFIKAIRAATGKAAVIKFKRHEYCSSQVKNLPAPRPGWEAFEIEMVWRKGGIPIGILVYEDSEKNVIVSMVESGTLASKTLKPGDVLRKINDKQVKDKTEAKKMIVESVNATNGVKLTMERQLSTATVPTAKPASTSKPTSATSTTASKATPAITPPAAQQLLKVGGATTPVSTAKSPTSQSPVPQAEKSVMTSTLRGVLQALASPSTSLTIPSVARLIIPKLPNYDRCLPPDVLEIMERHKDFYKNRNLNPPILKGFDSSKKMDKRINVEPPKEGDEHQIAFDVGDKPLKKTGKRVGS